MFEKDKIEKIDQCMNSSSTVKHINKPFIQPFGHRQTDRQTTPPHRHLLTPPPPLPLTPLTLPPSPRPSHSPDTPPPPMGPPRTVVSLTGVTHAKCCFIGEGWGNGRRKGVGRAKDGGRKGEGWGGGWGRRGKGDGRVGTGWGGG